MLYAAFHVVVIRKNELNMTYVQRESATSVWITVDIKSNTPMVFIFRSEKHIETWVSWASKKFNLNPALDTSRFPKSAEELATYSKADFYIICGSFDGGKRISQHYKYMMQNAREKFDDTLQTDCDPGEIQNIYY